MEEKSLRVDSTHLAALKAASKLRAPAPKQPRVWLLAGAHKGDNEQLITLAEALGLGYRVDSNYQSIASIVADRIARGRLTVRRHRERALAGPPWPDLVLISGGRRVGDALRIKRASGGTTKVVCIGRPWARLDLFDLVVTTPQYCLPPRPNVLQNTLTLNVPDGANLAQAAESWAGRFAALPRPWIAVLVGGNSGSYAFDPANARRLAKEAKDLARRHGGSLLVITSPRTPAGSTRVIKQSLDCPHVLHTWSPGEEANPYLAYLAQADCFLVTCDSASILSQACATGKPVRLFAFRERLISRVLTTLQRPLLPLLSGLSGAALWVPARDMLRFHDGLYRHGLLKDGNDLQEGGSTTVPDDLGRTVQLIEGLFPERATPDRSAADLRKPGRDPVHSTRVLSNQDMKEEPGKWAQSGMLAVKPVRGAR